jgi:hypothetical protein
VETRARARQDFVESRRWHRRRYAQPIFKMDLSFFANISEATFTVLSSRKNSLLSVYDVSSVKDGLLQSRALPYSLPCLFPNVPHAGFHVIHPDPGSGNATTASLVQLTSRGALYQTALTVCQNEDGTPPTPVTLDVSWSPAVHRLATASSTQRPDVGKLGARSMQEVDFRQAYQRISFFVSQPMLSHRSMLCTSFQNSFLRLTRQRPSIQKKPLTLSTKH